MPMNDRRDTFAEIAAQRFARRDDALIVPGPPALEDKYLPLAQPDASDGFAPMEKMQTPEQLGRELERIRERYAPFLQNRAPALPALRQSMELVEFDWRRETGADAQDFGLVLSGLGEWKHVTLPHYGAPLGVAVTYYRTSFSLDEGYCKKGTLFVRFGGVDYKTHVFINGSYLGSHEGFFSPFEFEFTKHARSGVNTLVVKVENDFICMGNAATANLNEQYGGDKIYAATGLGFDDAETGWHHCPPGMGIYNSVTIEARPRLFISDAFVRPLPGQGGAEAWVEAVNCDVKPAPVSFSLSLFGRNFEETVFADRLYSPMSTAESAPDEAMKDAKLRGAGILDKPVPLLLEKGVNCFRFFFKVPGARLWEPESPWLYDLQVKLIAENGEEPDAARRQFGMRSFVLDDGDAPKGRFFLNGRQIRLRGANTMGHEQQCVLKKDWGRLIDDILLAKLCNMNFLRLTQRPVQEEVYDFCDRLGLMTQTDLPLFAVLRYNQTIEAVRQAAEMERLVRGHPCNILVTYINEPFPNSWNKPHRYLGRDALTEFFGAADIAVRLQNPDRVIKPVDGDYDPPAPGLPDNHCYTCWYNGHGIDFGRLHKGYWQPVKEGWNYGCGEFGAEGLDPVSVMRRYYPAHWLPQSPGEERRWSPGQIVRAQTEAFYRFFYERPGSLEGWVAASHAHQAWATRMMAEAFRRDSRMASFAIHLFIDAFPSGWMKTIMDVERRPKPAYFAYREALTPLMANLRTDRCKFFSGDTVKLEAWVCNDRADAPDDARLRYRVEMAGEILLAGQSNAHVPACASEFQGFVAFTAPDVQSRAPVLVRLGLVGADGSVIHDCSLELEVFPARRQVFRKKAKLITCGLEGAAPRLAEEMGLRAAHDGAAGLILIDNYEAYEAERQGMLAALQAGASAVFLELPPGKYDLCGSAVEITPCAMFPVYFVSRDTGHALVSGFRPDDFRLWYDSAADRLAPLLESTIAAGGFEPVLTSGSKDGGGAWHTAPAAATKRVGAGNVAVCQVKLAGRTDANPVAWQFALRLLGLE